MSSQFSDNVRNGILDSIETTIGVSPTLDLRSGPPPANCAAADSGTLIAQMTLPSDWLGAASGMVKSKLGTWNDPSANASGLIAHYRIKQGATCHIQGYCSMAWSGSDTVVAGEYKHNGGNLYVCATGGTTASSGGPTGTGTGITDGTAVWNYVQTGTDMTIDNNDVAASQSVTVQSFSLTA